jgi:hypothetical protein
MGSFNAVMVMESERGKYTGPMLLPKNTFQISDFRVKKKGKSGLEKKVILNLTCSGVTQTFIHRPALMFVIHKKLSRLLVPCP